MRIRICVAGLLLLSASAADLPGTRNPPFLKRYAGLRDRQLPNPRLRQIRDVARGSLRQAGSSRRRDKPADLLRARGSHQARAAPQLSACARRGRLSLKLEIAGHTDSTGDTEHNLKLSQDRAAGAVVDALVKRYNIAPARLQAQGYGDRKPVAGNETEEGRAKNRRVELKRL